MQNVGLSALNTLAAELAHFGSPIIVFNKSHSGSRLLARLLREAGVSMGPFLNESEDAYDIMRIIRPFVEKYYPGYNLFFKEGDASLVDTIREVFSLHLQDITPGQRWGWKLCETLYILPILARLFPTGRFIHLVRDGRDVSFSNHVAPDEAFWKKIYFNTADISEWRGMKLTEPTYREFAHLFNAQHWVNSVTTARSYGAMLGERYLEIRYEDLVTQFMPTAHRLIDFLSLPMSESVLSDFSATIRTTAAGKYRHQSSKQVDEALQILEPTLTSFGYEPEIVVEKKRFWKF